MKTAHDYMLEAFGPEWSGKVWDMDRLKAKVERAITEAVEAERERVIECFLDAEYDEAIKRARTPAKGDGK